MLTVAPPNLPTKVTLTFVSALMLLLAACGSSPPPDGVTLPPVPCDGYNALRNPYFGDLHVHTTYSLDANTQGTKLTPHDAYRYARGERLDIQPYNSEGQSLRHSQLVRTLDFTAVTDHAELFGETEICNNPDYPEYNSGDCQFYREDPENAFLYFNLAQLGTRGSPSPPDGRKRVQRLSFCGPEGEVCLEAAKTPWADIQNAAAAYNDRCEFTSFVAYEYTGSPESNNLHRNVIFRTDSVPVLPPAYQENPEPEYLWEALARDCLPENGCDYLTIPHNSNLSQGLMFQAVDENGFDYTPELAQIRQQNEPLAEVHQHKGQSECLNVDGGSPDELCEFEVLPYNNLTGERAGGANNGPPLPQDFLRSALKAGLVLEGSEMGVNPFKYGFVGGSDTHLATSGNVMETATYPGHGGAGTAARDSVPPGLSDLIENNPGGLSVIWAEENTRDSLYAAMRRRETYATSGTRPVLRFFGGWTYPDNLCDEAELVREGYRLGVPMGGDLRPAPAGAGAPRFVVSALRDPLQSGETALDLQHMQIIKGWVEGGEAQEAVYDIAGNKHNGASVNVETCATTGTGFTSLCRVWRDPDFDPQQRAFYYVRVLENPSCRWSNRQCVAAGHTASVCSSNPSSVPSEYADCCNADYPRTIQERAWSSPIWYTPPAP